MQHDSCVLDDAEIGGQSVNFDAREVDLVRAMLDADGLRLRKLVQDQLCLLDSDRRVLGTG